MSDGDHLDWLVNYVAPHYSFSREGDEPLTAHIVQVVDGAEYGRLRSATADWTWHERTLYQGEPVLQGQIDEIVIHVNCRRPLVTVYEPHITTIVSHPDDPEAKMEPIRHVREITTKQLEAHGWFVYHGASVSLNGAGVIIMGEKGAGKSSLALGACASGALLVSNDRTYVGLSSTDPAIRAWPTTAAIGLGTLCGFRELHRWLAEPAALDYAPQDRYHGAITLDDALALTPPERAKLKDKLELTCPEVAQSFGTSLCEVAPLKLIVVPSFGHDAPETETEISPAPADVRELIRSQCYTPNDPSYPDFLDRRAVPISELERQAEAQMDILTDTVPVIRLRYEDGRAGGAALATYVEAMV